MNEYVEQFKMLKKFKTLKMLKTLKKIFILNAIAFESNASRSKSIKVLEAKIS
jgi:hypothetical protein